MSIEDNLSDLEEHAQEFVERRGFTYTVLEVGSDEVIGCVYILRPKDQATVGGAQPRQRAKVSSWVRADRAQLDRVLYHAVLEWLERDWPFDSIEYAPRA